MPLYSPGDSLTITPRRRSWVFPLLVSVAVAIAGIVGWLFYYYGAQQSLVEVQKKNTVLEQQNTNLTAQNTALTQENAQLTTQMQEIQKKLTAVNVQQIEQKTCNEFRQSVKKLQDENQELKSQLAVYKGIGTTPTTTKQASLVVKEMNVTQNKKTGQYTYNLVIAQLAKDADTINGKVELSIWGNVAGKAKKLTMQDISATPNPITYKFKNFQRLEGSFKLPKQFVAGQLNVNTMIDGQKKTIEAKFKWKDLQQ